MITYDQKKGFFLGKRTTSEVIAKFAPIEIGSISIILISGLMIFHSHSWFGPNNSFESIDEMFMVFGTMAALFGILGSYIRLKNLCEVNLDFNLGLILTYNISPFSEKKLIREDKLLDFRSAEIIVSPKGKRKIIILRRISNNSGLILGSFSLKNRENFDPNPLITDLESFFSANSSPPFQTESTSATTTSN